MALVKGKENSIIISGFVLDLLEVSFQGGVCHQRPVGSTYWVTTGEFYFDSVTIYLKHFNQSHSCMHNKGYIAACVNYFSDWMFQIKRIYFNLHIHWKSKVNTSWCIITFWSKLLYSIIKMYALFAVSQ